jgi:hypothetical protein
MFKANEAWMVGRVLDYASCHIDIDLSAHGSDLNLARLRTMRMKLGNGTGFDEGDLRLLRALLASATLLPFFPLTPEIVTKYDALVISVANTKPAGIFG